MVETNGSEDNTSGVGKRRGIQIGAGILLIAAVVAVVLGPTEEWLRALVAWVEGLGAVGGVVFAGAYILATVFFVPGLILTIAAGFLFGWFWGVVAVSVASTSGALAAFFIGRYLARDAIRRKLEDRPRFHAIDRAIEQEGLKVVLLTRLVPLFPFNLLNYAYGLTGVSWQKYLLASWLGMLPGTIAYVYVGAAAGSLARAFTAESPPEAATYGLWGVGIVAVIGVVWILTRRARQELESILDEQEEATEGAALSTDDGT